jgi:hypothetical protein
MRQQACYVDKENSRMSEKSSGNSDVPLVRKTNPLCLGCCRSGFLLFQENTFVIMKKNRSIFSAQSFLPKMRHLSVAVYLKGGLEERSSCWSSLRCKLPTHFFRGAGFVLPAGLVRSSENENTLNYQLLPST